MLTNDIRIQWITSYTTAGIVNDVPSVRIYPVRGLDEGICVCCQMVNDAARRGESISINVCCPHCHSIRC
jgi:hypothetical protein